MRFALFASSLLVALAVGSYACSSDDKTTPTIDAGSKATSSSSTSSSGDDDDSPGTSSSSSSTSGSPSDGGSTSSTTSSGGSVPDSGALVDAGGAGVYCTEASIVENTGVENDTAGAPQVIPAVVGPATTTFCGRIETVGDVDYWQYTFTQAGSGHIHTYSQQSNGVTVTGTVDGTDFTFANIPYVTGKPYLFKIAGTAAKSDYRVTVEITP